MKQVQWFLTHAVELETEAADRYEELADAMAVHHNAAVETLFRRMAGYSRLHRAEAVARARTEAGGVLKLKAWEHQWPDGESPESGAIEDSHYRMTEHHALQLALAAEHRAHAYYAGVAAASENARVRALAAEFAAEEAEHAELIERWIERYPPPEPGWDQDPDPPVGAD